MKSLRYILLATLFFAVACAPVFKEEIMANSTINPVPAELNSSPESFKGKMFIFGGRIVNTRTTKDGMVIEAIFLNVDSRGNIDENNRYVGRFLAILPKEKGLIDPLIFRTGKDVTIAGIYRGIRTQMMDKLEYGYSYFEIAAMRLWEENAYYYGPVFYTPYPQFYWWYGPSYHRWR
jgi:outer membrane lipoprotein